MPEKIEYADGYYTLPGTLKLYCDQAFLSEAELFAEDMKEYFGVTIKIKTENALSGDADIRVIRADGDSGLDLDPEGYCLDISPSGIELKAAGAAGAFYAFQTLAQMISADAAGDKTDKVLRCASVKDAPYKKLRAIHCYVPPKSELGWFKRFARFLARYRYNTIFLEIGASMRFESHPELNEAWEKFSADMRLYPGGPDTNKWGDSGMQMLEGLIKSSTHIENGGGSFIEKKEMADLADFCRKRHISIIPEVQSFAHAYWLLLAHPECAERPDDPYPDTWCPSNPRTYEIYFDCMQEIIDAIKPSGVSMGNDELQWTGLCDKCKDKTGHDLLAEHITRIRDWLKAKNITSYIWGDKLLHTFVGEGHEAGKHLGGEELWLDRRSRRNDRVKATFRAADMIPADVVIGDWYYGGSSWDKQETYDYLAMRGMSVYIGNFSVRRAMPELRNVLRRPHIIGAKVSIWHETSDLGMSITDNFAKYLDAANILWHRGWRFRDSGEYSRAIGRLYPMERDRANLAGGTGRSLDYLYECLDISQYYNSPLDRFGDCGFIAGAEPIGGTPPFAVCSGVENAETDPASVYAGGGGYIKMAASGKFDALAFLHAYTANLGSPPMHACSYVGPEEDICGHYEIYYEDGASVLVPIEYARNIYAIDSWYNFGAYLADPVFQKFTLTEEIKESRQFSSVMLGEQYKTIFAYRWTNPFPDKKITGIAVRHAADKPGGIVLFALTGAALAR
jgi:hypothetical protein